MHNHAPKRAARAPYLWATVVIGIPVIALLAIPLYARTEPVVLDLPMFYWWTFVWIAALSAGIGTAFHLLQRAEVGR